MVWTDITIEKAPPLSGHDSFIFDGKIYYLGWDDQIQFLVLDPVALNSVAPNIEPWIPDGPIKKEKIKLNVDTLKPAAQDDRRRSVKSVNKKVVYDRIEKLEYFSNSLTISVVDLLTSNYLFFCEMFCLLLCYLFQFSSG